MRFKLPILLAPGFCEIKWIILGPDSQVLQVAGSERVRDVSAKRRVTTMMPGHLDAIDPNGCTIIDCPEVQEHTIAGNDPGTLEQPPVPDGAIKSALVYATGDGLRTEWDNNLLVPFDGLGTRPGGVPVKRKIPSSIET